MPPDHPAPGNLLGRLIAFIGLAFCLVAVTFGATLLAFPHAGTATGAVLQALALVLAVVPAYVLVARLVERRRPPHELDPRRAGGLISGFGAGVVGCALVVGVLAALGSYEVTGTRGLGELSWVGMLAIAGLQAAVVEEILFRGILFRYLEEIAGTGGALVVSALGFGAAHLGNPGASLVTALAVAVEAGLLFGAVYALTRSLWVVIGLHLGWNLAQGLVFGSPVSGTPTNGWLVSRPAGHPALSGGAFGVEASVACVVILTAVAAWALAAARRRRLLVGWRGWRHAEADS